jgi:hypothetical protein
MLCSASCILSYEQQDRSSCQRHKHCKEGLRRKTLTGCGCVSHVALLQPQVEVSRVLRSSCDVGRHAPWRLT